MFNGITPATILSALLACATQSDQAPRVEVSAPSDIQSQVESGDDQHFCCDSVDSSTWSGQGCLLISEDEAYSCSTVLYCDGPWERQDGRAACIPAPGDKQDRDVEVEDQHFCCKTVDTNNWTGEDCTAIPKELLSNCANVLYCDGKWNLNQGHAACE